MAYGLAFFVILALVYGPSIWVKYVLWRHSRHISDMPGTGAELAEHLVERFSLEGVQVKKGNEDENYYSPDEKIVCLSPDVYEGKSLTAVATAAHEIGHAIQFCRDEPVSHLRKKYMGKALRIKKIGSYVLMSAPIFMVFLKTPLALAVLGLIGILSMLTSVMMYAAILPEEYDASFKKALPILKEGYLPEHHIAAAAKVLRACAYTYLAAALADVLRLWRWIRFLR